MKIWIEPGKTYVTKSGMVTTPSPEWGNLDTNRKCANAIKKLSSWIKINAISDAKKRGHGHLVLMWEREETPLNESIQNEMSDYLFSWDPNTIPVDSRKRMYTVYEQG